MANLLQCSSCSRHIRAAESTCPFCAGALPQAAAARGASDERQGAAGKVSRSKRYAVRAALLAGAAVLATGCPAKKEAKDPDDKVLVKEGDGDKLSEEELREQENERLRQEEMDRRNRDRQPDMPYGCVWPEDEVVV